jgi:hypothetical protein
MDNRVEDFDAIKNRLYEEVKAHGSAVTYEVTITKIENLVFEARGAYTTLTDNPTDGKTMGYAPSRPEIKKRETMLFSQIVPTIDIADVVKAVNSIVR